MVIRFNLRTSILLLATVCWSTVAGTQLTDFIDEMDDKYTIKDISLEDLKYGQSITFGSMANIFEVPEGRSFRFHMWPLDECLEVVLCSAKDLGESTPKATTVVDADFCNTEKMTFRTAEHTVTIGSVTKFHPRPDVVLNAVGNKKYQLTVQDDFDGRNFTSKSSYMEFTLEGYLVVLTSSPRCQIHVANRGYGLATHRRVEGPNGHSVRESRYAENHKVDFNPILDGVGDASPDSKGKCCPNFWQYTGHRYFSGSNRNPSFAAYEIEVDDQQPLKSVMLEIDKPEKCQWVRVCFGDKSGAPLCQKNQNVVDLILGHRVFLPTDHNHARSFGINIDRLKQIQFRFFGNKLMEMAYAVAHSSGGMLAREQMNLDWEPKTGMVITVATSPKCNAMLAKDNGRATKDVVTSHARAKQGISIMQCKCHGTKK